MRPFVLFQCLIDNHAQDLEGKKFLQLRLSPSASVQLAKVMKTNVQASWASSLCAGSDTLLSFFSGT